MAAKHSKPNKVKEIESLTGLEFIYIPEGDYEIGTDSPIPTLKKISSYSSYEYTKKNIVKTKGYWISKRIFRKSNLEKLNSRLPEVLNNIIPAEELESYKFNMVVDIKYGINYGWKKVEKDYFEKDPIITLSRETASEVANTLGMKLPDESEWEIAARGKEKFIYPGRNDFSVKEFNLEKLHYFYTWEDPESTMGYRDTQDIEGYKFRVKSIDKFIDLVSGYGLKDLIIFGGEWNKYSPHDYPSWVYRSFLDLNLSKSVYSLSESESENVKLRESNHRSFSGLPLYAYSGYTGIKLAGFRLVFKENEEISEVIPETKLDNITDWKLYGLLGEPHYKLEDYLGSPEGKDSFDSSTGASVYYSLDDFFYSRGFSVNSVSRFGKILRASTESRVLRIQKITLHSKTTKSLGTKHIFSSYKKEIIPGISLGEKDSNKIIELEKQFSDRGIKALISKNSEGGLSSITLNIENDQLLHSFKIGIGILREETFEGKFLWNTSEHNWHISSIQFINDSEWISTGYDGYLKFWNFESTRSIFTYKRESYSPGIISSIFLDENRLFIVNKMGEFIIFFIEDRKEEIIYKLEDRKEIYEIFKVSDSQIIFTSYPNTINLLDIEKKVIIYSIKSEFNLKSHPILIHKEKNELIDGVTGKFYEFNSGETKRKSIKKILDYGVLNIYYNKNKDLIYIFYSDSIKVFKLSSKKLIIEKDIESISSFSENPKLLILEEKNCILIGSFGLLKWLNMDTLETIKEIKNLELSVTSISFQKETECLYVGNSSGKINVIDYESGKLIKFYGGQKGLVYSLAYDFKNKLIASGDSEGYVYLYNPYNREIDNILKIHTSSITSIGFLDDGSIYSGSWDGYIKITGRDGKLIWKSKKSQNWVCYTFCIEKKNYIFYATKKAEIELINYKTGKVVFSLNLKKKKSEYIDLEAISVSEEKNEFSYYLNGFIYTHNLTTGKEIKKKKTEESFISCSYSPCGKYIFYSNGNGKIFRYDSKDLNIFKTAQKHNEGISSFVFNKSIMLTTGKESNGFFWDFDSLECLGNFTNTSGGVCPGTFYSEEEFCIGGSGAVVQFFKVTSKF